jgi:hypothetical protein
MKKIDHYPKKYNILSNLPLSEHHYDKPENRPKVESQIKKNKNIHINLDKKGILI